MESHTAARAATLPAATTDSQAQLSARVVLRDSIDDVLVAQMYRLYAANYFDTTPDLFRADFEAKSHVLMLQDEAGRLCGFSTIELYSTDAAGSVVRVVYSGDTIIDPAHWGSQALAFEWIRFAGEVYGRSAQVPLYWLLIVKGHRTYRFLPAFARRYVPHHVHAADAGELRLRNALADQKFGQFFDSGSGLVRFPACLGRLSPVLADIPQRHLRLPEVAHFLALNPGYRNGDELVCLCRLAPENLRPRAARLFGERSDTAGLN